MVPDPQDPSAVKRRVLIVDGDPSLGRVLEEDFRTRGFEAETVATSAEAISRVAAALPDLVVLDPHLPDGQALELLRLWKTQWPTPAVILVSGNASLTAVVDALKEGARGFFTKPVSAGELLDELDEERPSRKPSLSPLLVANHQLCMNALTAEGVDRFFAISPGLLSVAGFDGYFKMLNPAWETVLGYSIDELCATPYLELVHPDDQKKASDEALEIRGGETVFRFKNRYRCKDGSYRWLAWSATPSPAHGLIYASARDVTKSVRLEEGLRESNKQLAVMAESRDLLLRQSTVKNETLVELGRFKDEVAAMIVHDLKSPLSVIVSNYDYILETFEGSDEALEALRDSRNAGHRMHRLLANLIDVARLEGGTLDLTASPVALSQLLQSLAGQRRGLARSRGLSILLAPSPEMTIAVDPDLMTRAVENIFDNAIRYAPSGGTIEVELRAAGPDVELRIGNSGSAIPVVARTAIFEKYRNGGSDGGHMNLGLGLYFCRLAIEAHGGAIWVEESERLPTVFCMRLPRLGAGAAQAGAAGPSASA